MENNDERVSRVTNLFTHDIPTYYRIQNHIHGLDETVPHGRCRRCGAQGRKLVEAACAMAWQPTDLPAAATGDRGIGTKPDTLLNIATDGLTGARWDFGASVAETRAAAATGLLSDRRFASVITEHISRALCLLMNACGMDDSAAGWGVVVQYDSDGVLCEYVIKHLERRLGVLGVALDHRDTEELGVLDVHLEAIVEHHVTDPVK